MLPCCTQKCLHNIHLASLCQLEEEGMRLSFPELHAPKVSIGWATLKSSYVQLPPAPDALEADAAAAAAVQEAAAAAMLAQDQASVRQLRMALRGVAMKLLGDRRWAACAMPVDPEENPDFYARVRLLQQSVRVSPCNSAYLGIVDWERKPATGPQSKLDGALHVPSHAMPCDCSRHIHP